MKLNLPWKKSKEASVPAVRRTEEDPFLDLQNRVHDMFDEFFEDVLPGSTLTARGADLDRGFGPRFDVSQTEDAFEVRAELPGMNEKDVEVWVDDEVLTIRGEKQEESKHGRRKTRITEIRYGSFERSFRLPDGIDRNAMTAAFKRGVLTLTLPRTEEAKSRCRRIPVLSQAE